MDNLRFPFVWKFLAAALWVAAASPARAEEPTRTFSKHGVEINFTHAIPNEPDAPPTGAELYGQATIRSRSGALHELTASSDQSPFDASGPPDFSPGGRFVVLQTLMSGYADDGESRRWHEVPACLFVDTDSGQVVDIGTRGECSGEFTSESVWRNIDGHSSDLAAAE